jgi:pimeloyl-ACP methyl ester carboxylesterase
MVSPKVDCRDPRSEWYAQTLRLALTVALLAVLNGCSSNQYIVKRKQPFDPLASFGLSDWKEDDPSERTQKLLRRYDLEKLDTNARLEKLHEEIAKEPLAEKLYAFAELSYIAGKHAQRHKQVTKAVDLYAASIAHAYWFLFDPQYDRSRNPYDPQFRGACDIYNGSLEALLQYAKRDGQLRPGATLSFQTDTQRYEIEVVSRGTWHEEDFEGFEFVSEYDIKTLANRHHTYGLGVPLIAVRQNHTDMEPAEKYYPPGLSFAVTAFLQVMTPLGGSRQDGQPKRCILELHDPLPSKDIDIVGRRVPLETDLTTPLAFFLADKQFQNQKNNPTDLFFMRKPNKSLQGMFMVEPYDPQKIPVLMVHGLWSSPVTWMDMFNDLRSFPEIREQYQFWFYLYPTGQPFWISARQMREDLANVRRTVDPEHRSAALDQMVLVGHSMGGLVSKLQTVDSRDDYWKLLTDRPFSELKADEETRERLGSTVFFQPNPSIRSVVTIGTPHRGSDFANDYTRWLSRKLIRLPEMMVNATQGLTRNNPDFFKNTELLTISTSIDSLAPTSPVLPVILNSPTAPWTKYHNVIGITEQERLVSSFVAGGDGVVTYESAHLDNVASEISVAADHLNIHRHPRTILHVRQILLDHRDQMLAEMGGEMRTLPAGFQHDESH